jgi:beta-phosphoglucomutase
LPCDSYEAVLFDFDGVLIDSEPVHLACWLEALSPFGIHVDWDTYITRYVGVADKLMIAELCERVDPPVPFEEAWARYAIKKQLFQQRMQSGDMVPAEVMELLGRLHGTVKMAVVTSSARSEIEPILTNSGLLRFLETAVYAEDTERLKPAPDPYLLAASRLGVTCALVVEDSNAGLESGRAAGFDVLRVPRQREMVALVSEALATAAQ